MIIKAVKKPVTIECVQWKGDNFEEIRDFCGTINKNGSSQYVAYMNGDELMIQTLEGDHHSIVSDFIIKGIKGECYPCKEGIFYDTYDVQGKDF